MSRLQQGLTGVTQNMSRLSAGPGNNERQANKGFEELKRADPR